MTQSYYENDPARKIEIEKKLAEEVWPSNLKIFEKRLEKNNGWLVGSDMTWVDMHLTILLDWLGEKKDAVLTNFPHCKALAEKVVSNPKIKEWSNRRPATAM